MQQFPFIDLFKSALHVSGDVFAHLQELFNCIYSFGTMHRPAADRCHRLLVTYTVILMTHGHTNIKLLLLLLRDMAHAVV
jgi:hypothetical protein